MMNFFNWYGIEWVCYAISAKIKKYIIGLSRLGFKNKSRSRLLK